MATPLNSRKPDPSPRPARSILFGGSGNGEHPLLAIHPIRWANVKFLNEMAPAYDLTYDDVFMVPSRVRGRLPARRRPVHPRRHRHHHPARRRQHDRGRRPPDGRDRRPPRRHRRHPAGHPDRRRRRRRRLGQAAPPGPRHRRSRSRPHDTVGEALDLLPKRAHGAVVVVDGTTARSASSPRRDLHRRRPLHPAVRRSCPTDLLTLPDAGIDPREAFDRLHDGRRRLAPVVDDDGRLVGILTRTGALRATLYQPAVDADGRLRVAAAVGINGDVAGKAEAAARRRRRRASSSTPRTATRRR